MAEFFWPTRVYYEDTDNGGVVYYANYLKFMERARTEWLRARGVEQDVLAQQHGLIFAVRTAHIDYLKPARFNQLLSVSVKVIKVGRASLIFDQTVVLTESVTDNLITHEGDDTRESGVLLCRGQIKIACLNSDSLKPCAIPTPIRQEILGDD
ncbi:tol-pal system-associated acyl-CoA thioesterase [Beggiatoa alba]|nr:tol-pal system-associated acyl-CoA thioesterase [Beggiatoa alba]